MSGVDEQDVIPCGCKHFSYWKILGAGTTIGYLNTDDWVKRNHSRAVNRVEGTWSLSKDDFVASITAFRCINCAKLIKMGHIMFDSFCRSVIARWDIHNVRGR